MYKSYFALKSELFRTDPSESSVFMGAQQVQVSVRLTEALSSGDTIVTVTGPVGSGKSTMVREALRAIPAKQKVARIARIQLRHDEVLDLLLSELEVEDPPAGTIQRFTEFKRVLKTWKDQGKRVFIVVEDAQRIGVDAISELESLTSESNGGACGASIVLMGLPDVNDLLSSAALARTRQRTSLQLTLNPFDPNEVQDYLAHQFSVAGGNIADAFASGAVDMIHRCTGGSPRVINKLCEAVLNAAAEADSKPVLPSLVEQVIRALEILRSKM